MVQRPFFVRGPRGHFAGTRSQKMAKDRHYFDKHDNYKGRSSDNGPYDGIAMIIMIAIFLFLIRGC